MTLEYPTFQNVIDIASAELRRQVPEIDPSISGTFARGFIWGLAATSSSIILTVRDLQKQAFPQTADGEFLDEWGKDFLKRLVEMILIEESSAVTMRALMNGTKIELSVVSR